MHQPRHWMLLARSLSLSRAPSVVGVHASSMCEPRSRRMCVGGIDGSSIDPPSHRVRCSLIALLVIKLLVILIIERTKLGHQGSSGNIVESSVRDRCRRSHVPSDGADSETRERLGARLLVLRRHCSSSRLVSSMLLPSPSFCCCWWRWRSGHWRHRAPRRRRSTTRRTSVHRLRSSIVRACSSLVAIVCPLLLSSLSFFVSLNSQLNDVDRCSLVVMMMMMMMQRTSSSRPHEPRDRLSCRHGSNAGPHEAPIGSRRALVQEPTQEVHSRASDCKSIGPRLISIISSRP